ncbi:DUF4864 domain-containing protein [Salinirubrum litoreum]|uniref:DUF4864 domain-containing protein n=1 Tax=Salinirubrum litoreum TaxID=1126234 RepID=A0ABD5R6W3_9EURY|nr:DUF4864 domain-containing protein [Salinirubrum litoreum]
MHDQHNPSDVHVPAPDFAPAEVVSLHLDAFGRVGVADTGADPATTRGLDDAAVQTAFRFASPAVRRRIGSAGNLRTLLLSRLYEPLVTFERSATAPIEVTGDRARQEVTVMTPDRAEAVYEFRLARADSGPEVGCWLVDAVDRIA